MFIEFQKLDDFYVDQQGGKFYPKRVIQIGGVELSTQICDKKVLSARVSQKKFYPNTYMTYLTLLYTQKAITQKYFT